MRTTEDISAPRWPRDRQNERTGARLPAGGSRRLPHGYASGMRDPVVERRSSGTSSWCCGDVMFDDLSLYPAYEEGVAGVGIQHGDVLVPIRFPLLRLRPVGGALRGAGRRPLARRRIHRLPRLPARHLGPLRPAEAAERVRASSGFRKGEKTPAPGQAGSGRAQSFVHVAPGGMRRTAPATTGSAAGHRCQAEPHTECENGTGECRRDRRRSDLDRHGGTHHPVDPPVVHVSDREANVSQGGEDRPGQGQGEAFQNGSTCNPPSQRR